MQIHQVKRMHPLKKSVQIGRGGKRGKTSGRGGKGQTARAGNKPRPILRDIIKKIPKLRGRGKSSFKSFQKKPTVLPLSSLEKFFSDADIVTPSALVKKGLIVIRGGVVPEVKILGKKVLTKKLIISGCQVSKGAQEAIEKAGGSVK